jgi:hypothetical protein
MMTMLDPEFDPGNYGYKTFNSYISACSDIVRTDKGEYDIMLTLRAASGLWSAFSGCRTKRRCRCLMFHYQWWAYLRAFLYKNALTLLKIH